MKKKGFTLIELLAVLVIIGILLALAIPSVAGYIRKGKKSYYHGLETTLKASSQEYLLDYRSLLPREIGNTTVITVEELVKNHYMDELLDEDKKTCSGNVTIEKKAKDKYDYHICLKCNDKYTSNTSDCELSGNNNQSKNYEINLNSSVTTVVEQCQGLNLPNATVYQIMDGKRKIITNSLFPSPRVVDTKILGETTVKWVYRYKSINKTIRVEDKTPPIKPTVQLSYLNGSIYNGKNSDGTKAITNQNLNIIVTTHDYACRTKYPSLDGSGISSIQYRMQGTENWTKINTTKNITKANLTTTLFGTVELKVLDNYGNSSEITTFEAYTDQVKPGKTTVTYLGGSNTHSWKNNYKLKLSAVEDTAIAYYEVDWDNDGIADTTTSDTFIPWNTYSSCNTRFRAVDIAGNRGEWSDTNHIHMDTESPSGVTVDLASYTSNTWTNKDVVNTYTATDSLSGISKYQYSYDKTNIVGETVKSWTTNKDGSYTIYVRAVDKAGNTGNWSNAYYIKRDTVKPNCTLKITNTPTLLNGWYITDINIGFNTTTDDRSNIKNTTIDIPVINTNSKTSTGTTVTGTITDNANNSNTCTIVIKADIESPKITAKSNPLTLGNQDYEFTNNINSTFGGLGGNIACNPAQSKKTGTYDVTCTATSNNGKSSTVTFTTKHSYAATATKVTDYNNCTGYKTCESSGGSSKSNCHYNSGTKETHCDYRFTCSCTGREETLSQNTNSSHTHCASYGTKTQYTCPNGGTLSGTTCVY